MVFKISFCVSICIISIDLFLCVLVLFPWPHQIFDESVRGILHLNVCIPLSPISVLFFLTVSIPLLKLHSWSYMLFVFLIRTLSHCKLFIKTRRKGPSRTFWWFFYFLVGSRLRHRRSRDRCRQPTRKALFPAVLLSWATRSRAPWLHLTVPL